MSTLHMHSSDPHLDITHLDFLKRCFDNYLHARMQYSTDIVDLYYESYPSWLYYYA